MTKIAIISQPEQGVLIDVGGCASLQEATQHLTYTLQVSSQFWVDQPVDMNLGQLSLTREELGQVIATLSEVGVKPRHVYAQAASTRAALRAFNIVPATGEPASLPIDGDRNEMAFAAPAPKAVQPAAEVVRETLPVEIEATTDGAECEPSPSETTDDDETVALSPCASDDAAPAGETTTADAAAETETAKEDSAPAEEPAATPAKPAAPATPHVLMLRQTLRSGQAISHRGHLVIIGDVNPGAEVIAEGDITIWGALRGIAHAGVGGNVDAEIRALKFDPLQLRIANAIARAPDAPRGKLVSNGPETARIVNGTIRISSSSPD